MHTAQAQSALPAPERRARQRSRTCLVGIKHVAKPHPGVRLGGNDALEGGWVRPRQLGAGRDSEVPQSRQARKRASPPASHVLWGPPNPACMRLLALPGAPSPARLLPDGLLPHVVGGAGAKGEAGEHLSGGPQRGAAPRLGRRLFGHQAAPGGALTPAAQDGGHQQGDHGGQQQGKDHSCAGAAGGREGGLRALLAGLPRSISGLCTCPNLQQQVSSIGLPLSAQLQGTSGLPATTGSTSRHTCAQSRCAATAATAGRRPRQGRLG